ncbi:Probable carboxylesterase 2 [Striga hermonthica]|uniref:Probable carboxylesterase 2 n=1 Tax=Striga hermonthica TaxID=68872 RepID=A0A9N7RIJ7_STRHE|nr:Probable carboxylesterase 2 [Striga hermonthica]
MLAAAQISSLIFFLSIATFHSLSQATAPNSADPILYDILPFIRVYRNGTVQRFIGQDYAPPSPNTPDPGGVLSKDVNVSDNLGLSARIYRPSRKPHGSGKLPLLIYFHGGGFFTESAFSPSYHRHLSLLAARARVVALSVNYRLAPENPLPAAYEDSWLALKWSLNSTEPWLTKFADFGRLYLGGDSAGANIAHHMAIRVGSENPGFKISGMFLNCPYFLGKRTIGNESAYPYLKTQMQKLWLYAYPNNGLGLDNPLVNPDKDPNLSKLGCGRVAVFVAGNDGLRFRGRSYVGALRKSEWKGKVRIVEFKGEDHVFNLGKPDSPNAVLMLKLLAYFLNARWV